MNNVQISVFPNEKHEKPLRNILGMNNLPRVINPLIQKAEKVDFDALNLRHIRFHDAALNNPGQQLVDVHRIFPFFHADENDPKFYFFEQTDDYLKILQDSDAEIDFRIGESIDHSTYARFIGVPDDIEKWARVCRNIIGHYKNGEMNGMHLNITRVTVWEEPDNRFLFSGNVKDYTDMFCALKKILNRDFPDIKVGGPASPMPDSPQFFKDFLALCKERGVKPDYITNTVYLRTPEDVVNQIKEYRGFMEDYGFNDLTQGLAEWHLGPVSWLAAGAFTTHGYKSSKSAAFSASLLMDLMDLEYFDVAYYYCFFGGYGIYDISLEKRPKLPVFYGLKLFQMLASECEERANVTTDNEKVRVLAGKTTDGKTRLLISCFEVRTANIEINVEGVTEAKL